MKCISRSTFGVVLGSLSIFTYVGTSIYIVLNIVQFNALLKSGTGQTNKEIRWDEDEFDSDDYGRQGEYANAAAIAYGNMMFSVYLVICLSMAIISALLIVGIVKRRHSLIAPWLVLSSIGFGCTCIRTIGWVSGSIAMGISIGTIFIALIIQCLGLGLQALILYTIYSLYKDIRAKNNNGQIIRSPGEIVYKDEPPKYYTIIPEKA